MMKHIRLIIIILWSSHLPCFTQINKTVKQTVTKYPKSLVDYQKLAKLINKDFDTDIDKAGAIYYWITQNISYDLKEAQKPQQTIEFSYSNEQEKAKLLQEHNDKIIHKVLKKQKAICDGYARLFKSVCELSGIECVMISGTSKTTPADIGKEPKYSDHSWNAIKINQQWQLIDCTWGAGYTANNIFTKEYNEIYFLTPPDLFFLKHYPDDKRWLLTNKSEMDFTNLPLFYSSYLDCGFEITTPKNGMIHKVRGGTVTFSIKSTQLIPNLRYKFSYEQQSTAIEIQEKNQELTFNIPTDKRKKGYLTLYYKGKALVSYMIRP